MARLIAVCRTDDYQFERRQLPMVVDDNLKMVVQFSDSCVECQNVRGIKQKELENFVQRFSSLTKDEIAVELMVTNKDIMNLLAHMVPCVGCRRSVERLFNQLVESQHPALEPLLVTRRSVLSLSRDSLFDPKALYALFYIHGAKLNAVMESIPKSKKNRRCNLHSLETHKPRTTGSWIDIWDLLAQDCREEVVLVDADSLLDTLENYLRKHRFCSECKAKVLRAYSILVGDLDSANEKGYCAALYEGLRCCPQERHIHMLCDTDYIAHLIGRAEPELVGGNRRDRHAKTLDIAQEEVLTCLGIHIYERLHKIWQKLKEEEQTWQILFYLGADALKKCFEAALERKQGVSNLELMCEEILEEERAKEQRREQKRQKRKKKKAKSNQVLEKENVIEETHCECDKASCDKTYKPREKCKNYGDQNSNTTLASKESCRGNLTSKEICRGNLTSKGSCSNGSSPESCYGKQNHKQPFKNGSQNSDCGYGSDPEGCESCSMPSSTDGSDILYSDGVCSIHDGGDSVCSSSTDGLDMCTNCLSQESPTKHDHTPLRHKCDENAVIFTSKCCNHSPDSANSTPRQNSSLTLSLEDMLEASCSSEDEDFISEEEIRHFKENETKLLRKRQELRETLKQRFNNLHQKTPSKCSHSNPAVDHVINKICNL